MADCPTVASAKKQRRWFAVLLGQGSEFAFVVFGAAQMANVLEPESAKSLTLAVALSMAATPILLVILNRLEQSSTEEAREADEIDEEQPRVIIAGFGRFGQITGRLLLSSGVKMVVLDHDRTISKPCEIWYESVLWRCQRGWIYWNLPERRKRKC